MERWSRKLPPNALYSTVNLETSMHLNSFTLQMTRSTRVCLVIRIAPAQSEFISSGRYLGYCHSWLLALQVYPRDCRGIATCEFFDPIAYSLVDF